ncbi:cytochrome c oxidase assembly protein [Kitasatospora sp. HPMI-4]|uniref:cytochrome c oxidase assembly protein n=1 Tax=Kitasatospora sp. HPMI-4 TaxID=3448443 RepID=UPI003F1B1881
MPTTALALGHDGPPPWHWAGLATDWTAEPVVLTLAVLLGGAYLLGVRAYHRGGATGNKDAGDGTGGTGTGTATAAGRWPFHRTAAFLGGLLVWVWVTCSGLGVYERILFTDRAVQVVLLLMLVPFLLVLGAPVSLLVETAPEARRERIMRVLRSRPSRLLMFPAVSTVLLMAPPWLLYFTPWYEKTLTSDAWNIGLHLSLVALGLLYYWPRLQLDPVAHEYPLLVSLVITFAEVIFDAGLALILIYGHHVIAESYYAGLGRTWGPTLLQDQTWGGNVIWVLGDLIGLPFLCALIRRMIVTGRAETAAVDAALDAEYEAQTAKRQAAKAAREVAVVETAAGEAAPVAARAEAEEDDEPQGTRPWWLDDPNLRHRFGGAQR